MNLNKFLVLLNLSIISLAGCFDGNELAATDTHPVFQPPDIHGRPDGGVPAAELQAEALAGRRALGEGPAVEHFPSNWPKKPIGEWTLEDARAARVRSAAIEEAGKAIAAGAFSVNPGFSACCLTFGCAASGFVQIYRNVAPAAEPCVRSLGNARYNNLSASAHAYFPPSFEILNDNVRFVGGIVTQDSHSGLHRCLSIRVYQGPGPTPPPSGPIGSWNGTGLVIDRWGCSNYAGMGPSVVEGNIPAQSGWGGWDGVTAISTDYWEI